MFLELFSTTLVAGHDLLIEHIIYICMSLYFRTNTKLDLIFGLAFFEIFIVCTCTCVTWWKFFTPLRINTPRRYILNQLCVICLSLCDFLLNLTSKLSRTKMRIDIFKVNFKPVNTLSNNL